jgi:hypothetical protein
MPPKTDKKAAAKKAEKIIEDKTFGLKNKNKSKKVQQYVNQVTQAVKTAGRRPKDVKSEEQMKEQRKLLKQAKEEADAEINSLFKSVTVIKQQEVAADVDPKSVICAYFKAGSCRRGNKCKYSHDLEAVRKVAKINLYSDPRDKEKDTMENWDQATLEAVVAQKYVKKPTETEIVCKYFLDAVEKRQYGWFWECPSGASCHYRHALPPGYVLKSQLAEEAKQKAEEEEEDIGVKIEEERAQLDFSKCTPVTVETFSKWKEEQKKKREAAVEEKRVEAAKKQGGKGLGVLSGRDLFTYDPSLFVDDDEAAGDDDYEIQETDWNNVENKEEDQARPLYNVEEVDDEEEKADEPPESGNNNGNGAESKGGAGVDVGDASLFLDDDALPEDD